jgi:pseudaminic acid biosynthesis-associated methylase
VYDRLTDGAPMSLNDTEAFWAGEFGTEYTARNAGIDWHGRVPFWNRLLQETEEVQSVCELGANCGLNLIALKAIDPALSLTGVEINDEAFQRLTAIPNIRAIHSSVRAFAPAQAFDLVFTSGLLIHLAQEALLETYAQIAGLAHRYVLLIDYFNPEPFEVTYRGHEARLWKRDFGSEFLKSTKRHFRVVNYGFLWKPIDTAWDNVTWWLFESH